MDPELPIAFDPRAALYDNVVLQQSYSPNYGSERKIQKLQPPIAQSLTARKWLDYQSIGLAFLLPMALFALTFCVMSFKFYYHYPSSALFMIIAVFFFVLALTLLSMNQIRRWKVTGVKTWHLFLIGTSFLAASLGSILGYVNFKSNAVHYYDYISLRKIANADPGQWQGGQALDAGEIQFKAGTKINTQLNMMYFQKQGWCAAPIVSGDGAPLASYDFWAVGMNCCSSVPGDFSCGYSVGGVSGLRVLDDSEIAGYKLAVEQAQAAYNIQSHNPIFLRAVKSPYLLIKQYWNSAMTFAYICLFGFAFLQAVAVAAQAYKFWKDSKQFYGDRL
jgi:hypothetical protein